MHPDDPTFRHMQRMFEEQERLIRDAERLGVFDQMREGQKAIEQAMCDVERIDATLGPMLMPSAADVAQDLALAKAFAPSAEAALRRMDQLNQLDRAREIEDRLREEIVGHDRIRELAGPSLLPGDSAITQTLRTIEERERIIRERDEREQIIREATTSYADRLGGPGYAESARLWEPEPVPEAIRPIPFIPEEPGVKTNALLEDAIGVLENAYSGIADLRVQVAEERKEIAAEREELRRSNRTAKAIGIIGCALMAASLAVALWALWR